MAPTMTIPMPMGDASSAMTADATSMSMATPTAIDSNSMGGMGDMNAMMGGAGSDSSDSMGPMAMTFFFSSNTSLFFRSWTPPNAGAYVATCVFLLLLAVLMRAMLALKPILETSVWKPRRGSDSHEMLLSDECCDEDQDRLKEQQHLVRGRDASSSGIQRLRLEIKSRWYGWRLKSRWLRAMFEMALAILGYLL
ncbi:hypothetical protein PFICI_04970 [Pestalotiopsis fici W106-1]|uniref:Copper transport protein n=1 Tax=Pestalotiopsis fici (strain W106-1 / CGMCC3.15140) TaxID=1229662 RepID=W3XAM9_PESFW|nr:uncharacterized protein PFICI_04970 [Pestalotiopsis fici W106-1]ETS83094.1 hypothetical protein PFICI_04970 [Pestalotiopsis fici W106-1]